MWAIATIRKYLACFIGNMWQRREHTVDYCHTIKIRRIDNIKTTNKLILV